MSMVYCCTDGDAELIEKGTALLEDIAYTYAAKRAESMDTIDEMPEIRFYYEGIQSEEIADTLRSFSQLGSHKPLDWAESLHAAGVGRRHHAAGGGGVDWWQALVDYNPLLPPTDDTALETATESLQLTD